jgi:hypothetical protein
MQLDATVTFVFEFETQTTTTINLQLTWEEHEILTFVTNLVGAMIDSFAYLLSSLMMVTLETFMYHVLSTVQYCASWRTHISLKCVVVRSDSRNNRRTVH